MVDAGRRDIAQAVEGLAARLPEPLGVLVGSYRIQRLLGRGGLQLDGRA